MPRMPAGQPRSYRGTAKESGQLEHLSETLAVPISSILRTAVEQYLHQPGVQRLLTMSLDERMAHEVDNVRAGRPRYEGIEH